MRKKPGAIVPLSEAEWIIGSMELTYPGIVGQIRYLLAKPSLSSDEAIELENLRQQEDELGRSIDLLRLRIRECLTGEEPAPPQKNYVTYT
nr:hypothetical protein [uncultured Devosia sp.]